MTFLVSAPAGGTLGVDVDELEVAPGESQVSVLRSGRAARKLAVSVQGDVGLIAAVVVKAVDEIPPPEPEPWDGGTP